MNLHKLIRFLFFQNPYGFSQLKVTINSNTLKALFVVAVFIPGMILLLFSGKDVADAGIDRKIIIDVRPPAYELLELKLKRPDPITPNDNTSVKEYATNKIIGKFNPVDAKETNDTIRDIASIDEMGFASSRFGKTDISTIKDRGIILASLSGRPNIKTIVDESIFDFAEKMPELDYGELSRNIVYPKTALKIGVEGKVLVRALINEKGSIIKSEVDYTENTLLNNAALDAINRTKFKPAEQNGMKVKCWITIPIIFELK